MQRPKLGIGRIAVHQIVKPVNQTTYCRHAAYHIERRLGGAFECFSAHAV